MPAKNIRNALLRSLPVLVPLLVAPGSACAEGYGIFEARALAMGGTTAALANTDNALFYNPALLAFHNGDSDTSRDGSIYFPLITAQISDTVKDVADIEQDDPTANLTTAINAFNANQNADTAQAVADRARDLLDAIDPLDGEDVVADGFVGLSLTEPSDREGAGFYLGGRVLGGGRADISDSDKSLANDYIDALDFIASGGQRGAAHPELFNGGTLIDPVDTLTSTAKVKGARIVEAGIALSKEYTLWGVPVAFGVTPKWMRVHTYEASQSIQGGDINSSTSDKVFNTGNLDLGVALEFAGHYRAGLAVKDVLEKQFETDFGNQVTLSAKPRLGLAYVSERLQLGMDMDLNRVEAVGDEASIQELSLGGEWLASRHFALRAGYRHDIKNERDDIASLGVGMHFGDVLIDVAYAQGGSSQGVSLQLGFRR